MNGTQVQPNFFLIGAAKCGTTSVADWLSQHPQVFMSPVKEPDYFYPNGFVQSAAAYQALFDGVRPNHKCIGEASVRYLFGRDSVKRIEEYSRGRARYLVLLRNPVDMAISFHAQRLFTLNENFVDFRDAWCRQFEVRRELDDGAENWYTPEVNNYAQICAVGSQLERVMALVEESRVKVILQEDLRGDTAAQWGGILSFLGLEAYSPSFASQNVRRWHRSQNLAAAMHWGGKLRRQLGVKNSLGIARCVSWINRRETPTEGLDASVRRELSDYFAPEVSKLECLLSRDLRHWKVD